MKLLHITFAAVNLAVAAVPATAQDASVDQADTLKIRTSGNNLNMRSQPFRNSRIVTSLPNGTVLRNLGCRQNDRWCEVATLEGPDYQGWMSARFLIADNAGQATNPAEIKDAPAQPVTDAAAPASEGEPGGISEVQIQFAEGERAGTYRGALSPGETRRYALNGDSGQNLDVQVTGTGADIYYQILNPDQTFLFDQMASSIRYTGELWQSGEHVIEVINRSDRVQNYITTITFN